MAIQPRRMTQRIYDDINAERERQNKKWGLQTHDFYKWMAIINEEMGEVCEEILEADAAMKSGVTSLAKQHEVNMREELIQVAACVVAFLEQLERQELTHREAVV